MTNGIVQIEVTGPAGVGKTTVLALIKNELETLGFQVVCIEKVALATRSVSRDHFLMSGGYRPVIVLTEKLGSPRFAPPVPDGEAVAELNAALGKAFPDDQVSAIKAHGAVLPIVRRMAERLALMDKHAAIDNEVIQMLIAAGHITPDVSTQAFKIAHGFEDGPLPSSPKRVEALALRNLADNGYVSEAVVNHALLFARDEYDVPLKPASAANPIATGARPVTIKTAKTETDEFADIREFRRREAEMDRQDAERAAAAHEAAMRGMFTRKTDAATAPHISGGLQPFPFDGVPRDGSIPVYGGDPEFDALAIGADSIPEAPKPLPSFQHESPWIVQEGSVRGRFNPEPEPTWKRDDEKTMLHILLLSAETTGFHGNEPAVHMAKIAKWTNAECRAVDEWCVAMHHQAADSGVSVPPKPKVLVPERPAAADSDALTLIAKARGPISAEELERAVVSIIVAETRYPEHHFSHAAKRIAELLTRDSAE